MKPTARRNAVEHARRFFGISERRACTISVDRTSVRYVLRHRDDGDLRSRLREIAAERRCFCCRRLGIMLAREEQVINHKKLLWLHREENLRVRRRRSRKRAMGTRVARKLDAIIAVTGVPSLMIVGDNGTALASMAILRWTLGRRIEWHYIAPGKPQQNGYVDSFNGRPARRVP